MEQENIIEYAGIWSRVGAFIIDFLIALILAMIISGSVAVLWFLLGENTMDRVRGPILIATVVAICVMPIYASLMDSSNRQTTLGKMLFRIKSEDIYHNKLSFGRALLKYVVMWSIPIYIFRFTYYPFILIILMAIPIALTTKNQALYDMLTGCLVVKNNRND